MESIAVVGAGLVGSLQALYLVQRGISVEVFERRSDLRKVGAVGGRSINLALSNRGWKALEQVGIADEIKNIAIPMKGRIMHDPAGKITSQPYGVQGECIYSVSRAELNRKMLQLASEQSNAQFHFEHQCKDIDLETNTLFFQDGDGNEVTRRFDRIIATDGAFSAVRSRLTRNDRFNYSQNYLEHGYKELNIPPDEAGSHQLEKNALHIWPRKDYMLIALPNLDGSFTCTLFFPFEGPVSFESLGQPEQVKAFFKEVFPDAYEKMPTLVEDFFENPTSSLVTVRCSPWNYKSKILLLGDAAHAIVPFYGQGMNAGFEDCYLLNNTVDQHKGNWEQAIPAFASSRKIDADAIAEMALNNFIEMRDLTADPKFLQQKQIEREFSKKHPDKWLPMYSQVTFSDIPYHQALKEGKKQEHIMRKIMSKPGIEQIEDFTVLEEEILNELKC